MARVQVTRVPLRGGLDTETPVVQIDPGRCAGALNYEEPPEGGYRRIDGYERFDGRTAPSQATYALLPFTTGSAALSAGETLSGATSGAVAEVLVDAVADTGSFALGDAAGTLVLFVVAGAFVGGEDLQVGAVTRAVASGTATPNGADTDTDHDAWAILAQEAARARIQSVPGSGPIRGVVLHEGSVYAFRDNAGASACVMHRASGSGWQALDLGEYLPFAGGQNEPQVGDTLTGATSGASATVRSVMLTSGSWSGNDAVGRLAIAERTGSFASAETVSVGATPIATASAAHQAVSLAPGGRYRFAIANFRATGTPNLYGVDGVNDAFEYDGTTFSQIVTGASAKPTHIAAHRQHLFLGYPSGSVQNSGTGEPLSWTAIAGSLELGIGDELTGFKSLPGGVLAIGGRDSLWMLYGTDNATWELRPHGQDNGMVEDTLQSLGQVALLLHHQGITSLGATDAYGDFLLSTLSAHCKRYINDRMGSVTHSATSRDKNQYRLFFNHNGVAEALYCTLSPRGLSLLPVVLPVSVRRIWTGRDTDQAERSFFGSDDGYIYELDRGTSFDGAPIDAFVRLPFNSLQSPEYRKHFFQVVLELQALDRATINYAAEFNYGKASPSLTRTATVTGGGGYWDVSAWGEFVWAGDSLSEARANTHGNGRNLALLINAQSTYDRPHTIQAVNIHYAVRRRERG